MRITQPTKNTINEIEKKKAEFHIYFVMKLFNENQPDARN